MVGAAAVMGAVFIGVVAFDQLTKQVVLAIPAGSTASSARVIAPAVNSNALVCRFPPAVTPALLLPGISCLAFVMFFGGELVHRPHWVGVGLASALGGASSNILDRLRRGAVVDFVRLGRWPAFNAADAAIVLGVTLAVAAAL